MGPGQLPLYSPYVSHHSRYPEPESATSPQFASTPGQSIPEAPSEQVSTTIDKTMKKRSAQEDISIPKKKAKIVTTKEPEPVKRSSKVKSKSKAKMSKKLIQALLAAQKEDDDDNDDDDEDSDGASDSQVSD